VTRSVKSSHLELEKNIAQSPANKNIFSEVWQPQVDAQVDVLFHPQKNSDFQVDVQAAS